MTSIDVSIAAVFVTAILGALVARRAAYDRVLAAIDLIGQGDAAKARHRLGTLTFRYHAEFLAGARFPLDEADIDQRIEDVFTILSTAIRLDAVRRSVGPRWPVGTANNHLRQPLLGARGPHRLLVDSARNWVDYWVRPVPSSGSETTLLAAIATGLGAELDDDDARSLDHLRRAWAPTEHLA